MYDQREKAQRDYEWAISGAREEGERLGLEKGELIGKVRLLQDLLGVEPTTATALAKLSMSALTANVADLQQQLRDRQA
ncbi:MAG: hypothetical protein IT422_04770 [Pirellulaceae bacterium]|nr:hypothetical protein [Pirellulaceae bacterium]